MTKGQILKAIRQNCIYCMGEQVSLVADCTADGACFLFPYRFGTDPSPNPKKSEQAKIQMKNMLASGFGKKKSEAA